MHTHRYSIVEPESGRYWSGQRAGGLQDQPRYWYDEKHARESYAEHLEYCAARVNNSHPLKMRLVAERVVYDPPVTSDLIPADNPDRAMRGAFRRFHRKQKGLNRNWAVAAFTDHRWRQARPALVAMARLKNAKAEDIRAQVADAVVDNYYSTPVVGVVARGDILVLRSCFEVTDVIDLDPFWADFEQRFPGVRPAVTRP